MTPTDKSIGDKLDAAIAFAFQPLTDDEIRAIGETRAKSLVDSGLVASAPYDHATGEVRCVLLSYPNAIVIVEYVSR